MEVFSETISAISHRAFTGIVTLHHRLHLPHGDTILTLPFPLFTYVRIILVTSIGGKTVFQRALTRLKPVFVQKTVAEGRSSVLKD